jgi:hypothetical protein
MRRVRQGTGKRAVETCERDETGKEKRAAEIARRDEKGTGEAGNREESG